MSKAASGKLYVLIVVAVVGFVAAALWYFQWPDRGSVGKLQVSTILPAKGRPYSVAISPDGTEVAMVHREHLASTEGTTDVIEVRDVQSGREVRTFPLPTIHWTQIKKQYSLFPRLSYCDGGKYLLAFTGADTLAVVDAHTFQLHASISLNDMHLQFRGHERRSFGDMPVLFGGPISCSVNSNLVVLGFWADLGVRSIKLIDLDEGAEIADLEGSPEERYQGGGLAISPDGSKVAMVTFKLTRDGGLGVDLVDTKTKQVLRRLRLRYRFGIEHPLAFAGDNSLVIGETPPTYNDLFRTKLLPHDRMLRVWDLRTNRAVKTLGAPGANAYRSFGASADGKLIFAYTGAERYCKSCNGKAGEIKIEDARFTVWNRGSGKVVARSPKLKVELHTCAFFQFMAACTAYEQVPELQMCANGKAILAFWPSGDLGLPYNKKYPGDMQVFRLP